MHLDFVIAVISSSLKSFPLLYFSDNFIVVKGGDTVEYVQFALVGQGKS